MSLGQKYFSQQIQAFLQEALDEDWGRGDLFELIAQDREVQAKIIAKSSGIFSGEKYLGVLCGMVGVGCKFERHDCEAFREGDTLVELSGSSVMILKIERVALNILQHSSGIATQTHTYAQKIKDYPAKLLDTRKTRPLLRALEKYSVRNGGGFNHRFGLDDALMLKDTHLKCIQNLAKCIKEARDKLPMTTKIEIECANLQECRSAFEAGADVVMCDNMEPVEIAEVVRLRNDCYPHILLEASGNITLDNIQEYAKTGVDYLSSGSLIHQATWLDLSLKIL
ncbi:nicotinate-nucleotide diphosphorylase (carboxylating) [Helicobacter enhydrae]|uniref:nicotinate-nucleotide diphosphorylase (carboxylating) n=1 Tax=Helicobacter enhydrae TaxID=222136 RepID=A0A1B1U7C4_9HELI|nr:carboxylating nicotinate-nucleotide diphosphorylase [Helicobacter enhydrae]ANV98678.1 nicotinate-nucleotide diphosphorylase (carboxylating) [Helicobacter enhydrae]